MSPPTTAVMRETLGPSGDEALVERLRRGESQLFEVLMRRHNQRLFRIARAIVRDDDDAEDVMQEAYVRAFTKLDQYQGRARFATWLTRIAVHEALARVRQRRPVVNPDEESVLSTMPSPEDAASNQELARVLEPMIDALPDVFRTVFVLRAVEGLEVAECAECLEIPEETVRSRYFRARQLLQRQFEQQLTAAARKIYEFHLSRCDRVVHAVVVRIARSG
jgi:RNA polymerase sigma-70 factor, ECF subfamily